MNKTTYTIKEIDEAFSRCDQTYVHADTLIAELTRPKHSFSEGQVVYCQDTDGYDMWPNGRPPKTRPIRHLTLTEHGDGVKALRDALQRAHKDMKGYLSTANHGPAHRAQQALAAFDATLSTPEQRLGGEG